MLTRHALLRADPVSHPRERYAVNHLQLDSSDPAEADDDPDVVVRCDDALVYTRPLINDPVIDVGRHVDWDRLQAQRQTAILPR